MKFLKDVNGYWINILHIKTLRVTRENIIEAYVDINAGYMEMSDRFNSYEKAEKELDKIMGIINKNE